MNRDEKHDRNIAYLILSIPLLMIILMIILFETL